MKFDGRFRYRLPESAVRYFIERGKSPELQWPITFMLHSIDHPDAVEFVVRELTAMDDRLEGTESFSHFALTARDEWERRQEEFWPCYVRRLAEPAP